MRPIALGRKNWLHVGSVQSGPKVAAILSVVESCRRIGAPLTDYLMAVLARNGRPQQAGRTRSHPDSLARRPPLNSTGLV